MHRILVATDGSPSSATAIEFAMEVALEHASEVCFVHTVPAFDAITAIGLQETGAGWPHEPSEHDHELLAEAVSIANKHGVRASIALLAGPPAEAIVAAAESYGADLTVVGSRGHGALASALLGSVSMGVMRRSKRPVLIVRGSTSHPATPAAANFGTKE